jgi:hypothetical protein
VIKHENADFGYFVHTGKTGRNVFRMLKNEPVYVYSGGSLVSLVIRNYEGPNPKIHHNSKFCLERSSSRTP